MIECVIGHQASQLLSLSQLQGAFLDGLLCTPVDRNRTPTYRRRFVGVKWFGLCVAEGRAFSLLNDIGLAVANVKGRARKGATASL